MIYATPHMKIANFQWRCVVEYSDFLLSNCSHFEFRKNQHSDWTTDKNWPTYDDNAAFGGMPKTLAKLYERFKSEILAALNESPALSLDEYMEALAARTPKTELTKTGEQFVIPGCEKDPEKGPKQGNLWD